MQRGYELQKTLAKYILSGLFLALLSLVFFLFVNQFIGFHYLASNVLAFLLSLPFAFFIQRNWVFRSNSEKVMIRFLTLQLGAVAVGALLILFFVEITGFPPIVAQAVVIALNSSLRFLVSRKFIFI